MHEWGTLLFSHNLTSPHNSLDQKWISSSFPSHDKNFTLFCTYALSIIAPDICMTCFQTSSRYTTQISPKHGASPHSYLPDFAVLHSRLYHLICRSFACLFISSYTLLAPVWQGLDFIPWCNPRCTPRTGPGRSRCSLNGYWTHKWPGCMKWKVYPLYYYGINIKIHKRFLLMARKNPQCLLARKKQSTE